MSAVTIARILSEAQHVLRPDIQGTTSPSAGPPLDYDAVSMDTASGGYDFALQVSTESCQAHIAALFETGRFIIGDISSFLGAAAAVSNQLLGDNLKSLSDGQTLMGSLTSTLAMNLGIESIEIVEPFHVVVKLKGRLLAGGYFPSGMDLFPEPNFDPSIVEQSAGLGGPTLAGAPIRRNEDRSVAVPAPNGGRRTVLSRNQSKWGVGIVPALGRGGNSSQTPNGGGATGMGGSSFSGARSVMSSNVRYEFFPTFDLGELSLSLTMPVEHSINESEKRVDVYVRRQNAALVLLGNPDMKALADVAAFGTNLSKLRAILLQAASIGLFPGVSLTGTSGSPVPQLPEFRADVFPMKGSAQGNRFSAVTVGACVRSGAIGDPEDVQLVLGDGDYAVLTNVHVTNGILKFGWDNGMYSQKFPVETPIEVQVDNEVQTATLAGEISINTFDDLKITIDPGTSQHVLQLGGSGDSTALNVKLADGRVVTPDDAGFTAPHTFSWGFVVALGFTMDVPSNALVAAFQGSVWQYGVRYFSRPFIGSWRYSSDVDAGPDVVYTRTNGVTKHIFSVGKFT